MSSSSSNSNAPLNSFASAATGLKSASSSHSNVKLSSAELLSMLKKPQTTTSSITTSVIGPSITSANLNPFSNVPSTVVEPIKSIAHPFKDDDYTLQGLINLIKACQSTDRNIFALGVDLENDIGLSMNQDEPLRESLLSPWYDEVGGEDRQKNTGSASGNVGLLGFEGSFVNKSSIDHRRPSALDSVIPSCYHIPSLPAALAKIASFSDETLFYIFYAMPGDRMQELAARELYSRNWRFYKPAKAWVCPVDLPQSSNDINSILNNLTNNNNNGPINFFLFDQSAWIKVKRSIQLQVDDLELSRPVNSGTASPVSSPEIMHGSGTLQSTSVTH